MRDILATAQSVRGTSRRHAASQPGSAPCVATVSGLDARNRVMVIVPGLDGEVLPARLLKGIMRADLFAPNGTGREVLLMFEHGQANLPIIIGLLESEQEEAKATIGNLIDRELDSMRPRQKKVVIEALAELVLKCGSGSITLREDGKIVFKGTHLLSRSSGPIRIKGGHVEIN